MKTDYHRHFAGRLLWQPITAVRPRPPHIETKLLKTDKSLTKICIDACGDKFKVVPTAQMWSKPSLDESRLLELKPYQLAYIRKVELRCSDKVLILARTVIPRRSLTGPRRRMLHLGSHSLGAFLFSFKTLTRSKSQYIHLNQKDLFDLTGLRTDQTAWGRRNVYLLQGYKILITEIFIRPDLLVMD